jgi:hypothetical protein
MSPPAWELLRSRAGFASRVPCAIGSGRSCLSGSSISALSSRSRHIGSEARPRRPTTPPVLMERSSRALVAALGPLTIGHLLAILVVILPFSLLVALVQWQREIQVGASLLVVGFGIFRFINRRHLRVLARIRPTQLGLWSFAVAIAHGAGLMLVPIYLGLCRAADLNSGHEAAGVLINADLGMAVMVSVVHSVMMIAAGGSLACLVYRYLDLTFVSRSWFNLDATWSFSLILVGALSVAVNLASRH